MTKRPDEAAMRRAFKLAYRGRLVGLSFARHAFDLNAAKSWAQVNGFKTDLATTTTAGIVLWQMPRKPRPAVVHVELREGMTVCALVECTPGSTLHGLACRSRLTPELLWSNDWPGGEGMPDTNAEAEEETAP